MVHRFSPVPAFVLAALSCVQILASGCAADKTSAAPDVAQAPDPGPAADEGAPPEDVATPTPDPGPSPEDVPSGTDAPDVADVPPTPDVPEVPDEGPPPPPYWLDLPAGYGQAHFEALEVDLDGMTEDVSFTLPPNTISFAVVLEGAPENVWMRLSKMVVPPGFPVVKNQGSVRCETCPNRVYASQGVNTSLAPNTPDVQYKTKGKYTLGMRQFTVTPLGGTIAVTPWSGTPLTARVLTKQWESETGPDNGTLDLNLFFTGADNLTADNATEHPHIVQMIEDTDTILSQTGITLGEVRFFDAPAGTPTMVETTIGPDSDLALLFSSSVDAPPGINVFFVSTIVRTEIEDQSTGIVLGIAGGAPGPPFTHQGTSSSGVALAWDDIPADGLGAVTAHELGHYLGLFHTTEQDGTHDPIEDTAPDNADNLMFWSYGGQSALTPGQAFVALRHPTVFLEAGPEPDSP